LDYEVVRALTLEALREKFQREEALNIVVVIERVESLAVSRGLFQSTRSVSPGVTETIRLPEEEREKVRQVLWDLTLEGLLFPGASAYQTDLHFVKRTVYGKEALPQTSPTPYDPEGYLGALRTEIPGLDPIILVYATEAVQTFLKGNLLASTVMLGVASEKGILLLIDAYVSAIQDVIRKSATQSSFDTRFTITKKFQFLRSEFDRMTSVLRSQVADDLDIQLDGVFNLIRNTRNDAGHPTGVIMDRRRAYANLTLFTPYCKTIYALITYFQANPIR